MGGSLMFRNIELKKSFFSELDLPLELRSGKIKEIKVIFMN